MMSRNTFNVGDRITIASARLPAPIKGEIVAIRHAYNGGNGNTYVGADVLTADGKVGFYYLHDIARWNPEIMKESFA